MNLPSPPRSCAPLLAAMALLAAACDQPPPASTSIPASPKPAQPAPESPELADPALAASGAPNSRRSPPLASSPADAIPADAMPAAKGESMPAQPPSEASGDPLELAIRRGARWLETFPEEGLRFDAALMLSEARKALEAEEEGVEGAAEVGGGALSAALDGELARARRRADRDDDHPHRRIWVPGLALSREEVQRWSPPRMGQARVNPNWPLSEAIFCDLYPARKAAVAYIAGPMRDAGGFHTTHAAWAWSQLHRRGCVSAARHATVARGMIEELRGAQAAQEAISAASPSREVDLFAERLMAMGVLGAEGLEGDVAALLGAQRPDGGWGVAGEGEAAYWRYHATATSVWALSVARSRRIRAPRSWPGQGLAPEPGSEPWGGGP